MDPDIFQIVLAGFMGMTKLIFAQYGVGMGISLNLNIAGTPTIDLLGVDLPFPCCLLFVMLESSASVACATECLAS